MAYGILKVDTITFTDAGVDKSVTISGLVQNPTFSGNITVTGTVSGNTIQGQTVSGATITGGVATITSGVFGLGSASNPSISFTGDANTGFYSPGADQVAVATNGTGRLFVNDNGQIGIGTNTSLLYPLNIQSGSGADAIMLRGRLVDDKSTILFVNNGAATNLGWIQVDATGFAIATGSAPTERLRIDATGQIEAASLGTAAAPTFSWTSDPNTGIYSPGADQVAISTGGSGRLFVDASGNVNVDSGAFYVDAVNNSVGINTASPNTYGANSLIVNNSTLTINQDGASEPILQFRSGTATQLGRIQYPPTGLRFVNVSGAAETLRITSAGLVGVGTSAPSAPLDLYGANNALCFRIDGGSGASDRALRITNSSNSLLWDINAQGGSGANGFLTLSTNSTPALTINSVQRVGIGTTSPGATLDVAGDIRSNARGTSFGFKLPDWRVYNSSSGNALVIDTYTTEALRVDSSNRLLVGTSSTSANTLLLVVGGAGGTNGSIRLATSSTTPASGATVSNISFANNSTSHSTVAAIDCVRDGGTWTNGTSHPTRLEFSTTADGSSSPTERMRITSGGNVLVGTTTDTARLTTASAGAQGAVEVSFLAGGCQFFVNAGGNANAAAAVQRIGHNTATGRSINAGGTINASGADYAEYMVKAGDFALAKGDVCGVTADGLLTLSYSNAVSFVVKSTNPSYVGGDTWGSEQVIGTKPGEDATEALAQWEADLETARQKVDRIAFAGQVPVNVMGAVPGQYIVPVEAADGGIEGIAKSELDLTLSEYMRAVGKVIAIEDDGRARIIVKVA